VSVEQPHSYTSDDRSIQFTLSIVFTTNYDATGFSRINARLDISYSYAGLLSSCSLQCFDTVGWVTERPVKRPVSVIIPKGSLSKQVGEQSQGEGKRLTHVSLQNGM